ncbi:MAG TPA: hypothetical protein VGC49_07805 [Solirubrobacterales bacterium]|jgi:Tfp pilus assembly protein PilW
MRARLRVLRADEGITLVELLVASAMGVVVMGAVASLVISAVRDQPRISQQADNISTARTVLDRMTHEIRNGIAIAPERAKSNSVSFQAYVRHTTCGGSVVLASALPSIKCQITYSCTTTACSRTESVPGTFTGTARLLIGGISGSQVFTYRPNLTEPTYVKMTLRLPNPTGAGALTVSSGASMRNATLTF